MYSLLDEECGEAARPTLTARIERMTATELDAFWAHVELDLDAEMNHPATHWLFLATHNALKNKKTGEETPMYMLDRRFISAQRIALILFGARDPVHKIRIETLCEQYNCVNPCHLAISEPKK